MGLALQPLEMLTALPVATASMMTSVMMIMTSATSLTFASVTVAVFTFEGLRHPAQELL